MQCSGSRTNPASRKRPMEEDGSLVCSDMDTQALDSTALAKSLGNVLSKLSDVVADLSEAVHELVAAVGSDQDCEPESDSEEVVATPAPETSDDEKMDLSPAGQILALNVRSGPKGWFNRVLERQRSGQPLSASSSKPPSQATPFQGRRS